MNTLKILGIIALVLSVAYSVVVVTQVKQGVDVDGIISTLSKQIEDGMKALNLGGVTNYDRVGYGESSDKITHGVVNGVLRQADGEGQESWLNNTGAMVFVKSVSLSTNGLASSTFRIYVGTSTSATLDQVQSGAMGYLPPDGTFTRRLIDGWYISTSTSATSTNAEWMLHNSQKASGNGLYGSTTVAGDEGKELLNPFIRAGEYINLLIKEAAQSPEYTANNPCNGECEAATSTARGFDLYYQIEWTATSTPTN